MALSLIRYRKIVSIVGDIIQVEVPDAQGASRAIVCLGGLALIEDGALNSMAQVIRLDREVVSLQVYSGTKGFSTRASVHFLGHPIRVTYSSNLLGRVFSGTGEPLDGNSRLEFDPQVPIGVASVNPLRRSVPARMIRTNVPMIDVFNCLVESQKIPIFSIPGEPYNAFLARIGIEADADLVVFAGLGLIFDEYLFFRKTFEDAGVFGRTVMFCNLATAPVVERLITPDLALTVAERFAVEHGKRVLVLLTDMTAYADAMKEIDVALERVPANRGYGGDLYTQLARRYEKACHFSGAGSVTMLAVTTMPGNDVTHPVPDNTGYITEGQFYLHGGMLDPFGSLSRLKQHVIGKVTREDHAALANTMIRLYAAAVSAEQKQAMAFDLSPFDLRLLAFGESFRRRFMDIDVSMSLEDALDLGWKTLAEYFRPEELLIKQSLIDRYFPQPAEAA
ncbi:MAG: V-type ATP synthase subunit B [Methylomonas sp.]|nr:V-type ATP synthase subunit B [Methylomonas sp.]PPD22766.1 MAG: V-type ATP synthase subunit B [Methylomonas sp.]PPD26751.1 MAG: V-type ATP synthase subunit B [Methylomonas sp.]PPD38587.1 MAG: V-type ATP synthase subunit B [Methylomonas sp.]PPD42794.1 MAG: V-type ATP synthase subunit B [Methylomonas sp.]